MGLDACRMERRSPFADSLVRILTEEKVYLLKGIKNRLFVPLILRYGVVVVISFFIIFVGNVEFIAYGT